MYQFDGYMLILLTAEVTNIEEENNVDYGFSSNEFIFFMLCQINVYCVCFWLVGFNVPSTIIQSYGNGKEKDSDTIISVRYRSYFLKIHWFFHVLSV